MEEKIMVNDILSGVKSDLTTYQNAISECENTNLRQTLQQISKYRWLRKREVL